MGLNCLCERDCCLFERDGIMYKTKSNWDYFCELMVVVPGLAAIFSDFDSEKEGEAEPQEKVFEKERDYLKYYQ